MFRPTEPRGAVYRIRAFGLKCGDEILRPCRVAVSVGPLPFGFREVENLVKDDPNETAIGERLKAWRDAGLSETLELTAVQFYVDYSAALGDGLRVRDPALRGSSPTACCNFCKTSFACFHFIRLRFRITRTAGYSARPAGK